MLDLRQTATFSPVVVILSCGGDKRTQDADIKKAMKLADQVNA